MRSKVAQRILAETPEETKIFARLYADIVVRVNQLLKAKGFSQKFGNITPSEQSHMDLLAGILKTYGIANPTTGLKAGVFKDKNLTALYAKIMKTAPNSSADAIAAGVLIEKTDIADIEKMIKGFTQADIKTVLNSLLSGSQKHLAAFTR